jgi:Na+-translocating ferredoxin:NAD+ oxidoreductase RnfE subunit
LPLNKFYILVYSTLWTKSQLIMKAPTFKRFNFTMALQWLIFLPMILPLCIVFGALQGVVTMVEKMAQRMWIDMEL